ncbi:MAG: ABC transporter permease [Vicinamibacterales bacterium]|nr:ABC transporter permease [Vicinamibacterales bacterium]
MDGLGLFLTRRLTFLVLLVVVVSSVSLLLAHLAPGDAVTELQFTGARAETLSRARARAGLDQSFVQRYAGWVANAVRLDFGTSSRYGRPVAGLVVERAANSAVLALVALLVAVGIGLPAGVLSGSPTGGPAGALVRLASLVSLSLPPLLTSLALALLAARTGWLPIGGMYSPDAGSLGLLGRLLDLGWHLVVPTIALALPLAATIERLQSRALAETMAEPYITSAHARGVAPRAIVWRHALRPALKPLASVSGIIVGGLLSGSFAVEIVTAWPGLGQLMFEALTSRDIDLVAGCAAFGAVLLALGTLVSDLALAAADPRLREPV